MFLNAVIRFRVAHNFNLSCFLHKKDLFLLNKNLKAMQLFDVYPLYDIEPVKGEGAKVWDTEGVEYLDFYGGHAVISIGHAHPHYVKMVSEQVARLGLFQFYHQFFATRVGG